MKPHEQIEMEMMRDQIMKVLPALLGAYSGIAKATKAYYDELVKHGFTEQQALKIVSEQGFMAGIQAKGDDE
jgi:hypothetical protein